MALGIFRTSPPQTPEAIMSPLARSIKSGHTVIPSIPIELDPV